MNQDASLCKISSIYVSPSQRYNDLSIFKDGGCPPSWICFEHIWTTRVKEYLVVFITVQNLAAIGTVVSKI